MVFATLRVGGGMKQVKLEISNGVVEVRNGGGVNVVIGEILGEPCEAPPAAVNEKSIGEEVDDSESDELLVPN